MNPFATLMRREWLQHRFGWSLMVGVPFALALLLVAFGKISGDPGKIERAAAVLPPLLAAVSLVGGIAATLVIAGLTSLFLVSGIARRDHADRSVEFWLSLPTGHASSLAAPLVTHLLLVPAAAIVLGLFGGLVISFGLVARLSGVGEWFALPWGTVLPAVLSIAARLLAGLPLALAWASPLILVVVLANAWLRRWGLPVVVVGGLLAGWAIDRYAGPGFTANLVGAVLRGAGQALFSHQGIRLGGDSPVEVMQGLERLPAWALSDVGSAVAGLADPLFVGCLAVGAALFAALVDWRRRGASAA